jgi:hypothetical protein
MKDLKPEQKILFQTNSSEALDRVRSALKFLWSDKTHSIHDKVAADFDYEELIAALLCAEAALVESESESDDE